MENFTYQNATKIIFGRETEESVGGETKAYSKNILLHYGRGSIKKSGLYDLVVKSLKQAGIEFTELPGVVPNPRIELVREGISICRQKKIDFILAVGGGSVIDSAKAIAAGFYHDGDAWELYEKKIGFEKALPVATILTIPASGSEASKASVVTNGSRKLFISNEILRPRFSIMNPELTLALPAFQTACGVADMFAHIVERYFTNTHNVDLTDALCEATLKVIVRNARLLKENPKDYNARAEIMWAGTIAHCGLLGTGRSEDWASHMIEHELSALYDVAHGAGLAVVVPAWMRYVCRHDIRRFAQYDNKVWEIAGSNEEVALRAIDATAEFFEDIGLPTSLPELGIDESRIKEMASQCTSSGPIGSFVELKEHDVLEILKDAM